MKTYLKLILLATLIITSCKKDSTKEGATENTIDLKANFTSDKTNIFEGENIIFENTSDGNVNSYEWTFEGGAPSTSSEENPTITYAKSGNYVVTLKVLNGDVSNTITKDDYITVNKNTLTANFKADKIKAKKGESIIFTDLSIGDITSREWQFPGATPNTSSDKNPEITYNEIGTYDISLKITDNNGEATETKDNYIEIVNETTNAQIPNDFVLYYDFNNNIEDKSSWANNSNDFNITYGLDKNNNENYAGVFSSTTNNYIKVPHSNSISLDKEMTISVWFYYTEQTNTSFFTLIEKSNPDDGGHSRYGMWIYNGGTIEICIEPDTCPGSLCQRCLDTATIFPNLNQWNHLAGTYDGTTLKIYVNGEVSASQDYAPSGISQTQFELFLGTDQYDNNPNYLNGRLDNFRLYNRALNSNEIKQLSLE